MSAVRQRVEAALVVLVVVAICWSFLALSPAPFFIIPIGLAVLIVPALLVFSPVAVSGRLRIVAFLLSISVSIFDLIWCWLIFGRLSVSFRILYYIVLYGTLTWYAIVFTRQSNWLVPRSLSNTLECLALVCTWLICFHCAVGGALALIYAEEFLWGPDPHEPVLGIVVVFGALGLIVGPFMAVFVRFLWSHSEPRTRAGGHAGRI